MIRLVGLVGAFLIAILIANASSGQTTDRLYLNYVAAINNESTFQYFVVVKAKNVNTGQVREYCTKGDFIKGALHREYHLGYDDLSIRKVKLLALKNKARYFTFKNDSAIWNIGGSWEYSMAELHQLEQKVNFDSLAVEIKKRRSWSKQISDDKMMLLYAHALFNRGILTGESNCFGGILEYVDENRKEH